MAADRDHAQPREPWFKRLHLAAVAILGLAVTSVALLFDLAPGLKPDPRDRVGADVSVFALEPGVTIGQWLERGFAPGRRPKLGSGDVDESAEGELLYVRTAVDGHKHDEVTLRYGVYFADSHRRVPAGAIDSPEFPPLAVSSPSERSVQTLWVPDLSGEGALFVRVELWDENGMLAVADSATIRRGRLTGPRG